MKLTVPTDILMQQVAESLSHGCEVTLRARGRSMHPYIRDGQDLLVLNPCQPDSLRVGDVVLALTTQGRYVVHRIVGRYPEGFVLMGDGNLYGREHVRTADVLALLTHIERSGSRIDCRRRTQRIKAWLLRLLWRTPRRILNRFRR